MGGGNGDGVWIEGNNIENSGKNMEKADFKEKSCFLFFNMVRRKEGWYDRDFDCSFVGGAYECAGGV